MSEHSTALATVTPEASEIVRASMFTEAQEEMIREMYAPTASDLEFRVLISIARVRRLNPLLGHIHFVKRPNKVTDPDGRDRWVDKWTCQVSIDGLRAKAEETGQYDGQDEPEFSRDNNELVARVRVYRKGIARPFVGVAFWSEFVQTTRKGDPVRMWEQMPRHMLAKSAEALGLRKAFPEELAGLYTSDEMGQASNGTTIEDPPAPPRQLAAPMTAEQLANRARNGSVDACEEVLRIVRAAPKSSPKLEAIAYHRLAEMAGDEGDLSLTRLRAEAAALPPDIYAKLVAYFDQRGRELRGEGDAAEEPAP